MLTATCALFVQILNRGGIVQTPTPPSPAASISEKRVVSYSGGFSVVTAERPEVRVFRPAEMEEDGTDFRDAGDGYYAANTQPHRAPCNTSFVDFSDFRFR